MLSVQRVHKVPIVRITMHRWRLDGLIPINNFRQLNKPKTSNKETATSIHHGGRDQTIQCIST